MFKVVKKDSIKLNLSIHTCTFLLWYNLQQFYDYLWAIIRPRIPIWSLSLILCGVECNNFDPLQHLTQIFFRKKKKTERFLTEHANSKLQRWSSFISLPYHLGTLLSNIVQIKLFFYSNPSNTYYNQMISIKGASM